MGQDDYRELQEAARDALYELLMQTEPGIGLTLHVAYGELRRQLERNDAARGRELWRQHLEETREERVREERERRERRAAWGRMPYPERMHRVLNVIGDGRLTIREVYDRLKEAMPEADFYDNNVRLVVKRLHDRGDLDRVAEPRSPGSTAVRYRYFRRAADPKLAELERQLNDKEA